jgi:phage shock protein PspC (stress-responsive transcriptional regulator)
MKKTVIININGIVFHIDEDAYERLTGYLGSLNHYFGNSTEGGEIISDIEARIAELLQPKLTVSKQSITIEDVEEILSILGSPEDIAGSDNSAYESDPASQPSNTGKKTSRRLYRDVENSVIGGVSSGLGAYFDIDPVFFRIIFIALVFAGGVSLIIYPILWIVIPAARTSAQKLEMRGKDINISNIERTVREEFNQIRSNMDRPDSAMNRIGNFFREFFNFFGVLLRGIFNVLRYIIGAFLILFAVSFSIAIIGALYFKNFAIDGEFNEYFSSVQDFLYNIVSPLNADTMLFLLFIILVLPIVGLIYLGLKLLIRFQAKQKWVVLVVSVIWILSIVSFTVLVFNEADNFRSENETREIVNLAKPAGNTLYVSTPATTEKEEDFLEFFSHSRLFFPVKTGSIDDYAGIIHIDVEKTSSATPEMQIIREARGEDRSEALESAKGIKVNYTQKDSLLELDPFFRVANDKRWKFYSTKIIIRLPIGTKIHFDENTRELLHNIRNINDMWDESMVSKTWIMTDNGLELMGSNSSVIQPLPDFGNKALNLQLRDRYGIDRNNLNRYDNGDNYGSIMINGSKYYYGAIDLDIKKSETNQVLVELIKTASGNNTREAQNLSNAIEYNYELNDSVLWLDPVFRFPENNRWNNQKLRVVVRLPINKRLYIHRDFEPVMSNISTADDNGWIGHYLNRPLIMKNEGLVKME